MDKYFTEIKIFHPVAEMDSVKKENYMLQDLSDRYYQLEEEMNIKF